MRCENCLVIGLRRSLLVWFWLCASPSLVSLEGTCLCATMVVMQLW